MKNDTVKGRADVCQAILREIGLGLLFDDGGPAPEAFELEAAGLTPHQQLVVRAALGFWAGDLDEHALGVLGLRDAEGGVAA